MIMIPDEVLASLREQYPRGCRVKLIQMYDPNIPKPRTGDLGTVLCVDDIGTIHVSWDCGSGLGVVYGMDRCTRVDGEEGQH